MKDEHNYDSNAADPQEAHHAKDSNELNDNESSDSNGQIANRSSFESNDRNPKRFKHSHRGDDESSSRGGKYITITALRTAVLNSFPFSSVANSVASQANLLRAAMTMTMPTTTMIPTVKPPTAKTRIPALVPVPTMTTATKMMALLRKVMTMTMMKKTRNGFVVSLQEPPN